MFRHLWGAWAGRYLCMPVNVCVKDLLVYLHGTAFKKT